MKKDFGLSLLIYALLACCLLSLRSEAQLSLFDAPKPVQVVDTSTLVQVEGMLSVDKVYPKSQVQIAVRAHIAAGWHINAHQPSQDYLIPTELRFEPLSGWRLGDVVYPQSQQRTFEFADQPLAVYEGEVLLGLVANVSESVEPGKYTLRGQLRYQACNDTQCLAPAQVDVIIPIEVVGFDQPVNRIHPDVFAGLSILPTQEPPSPDQRDRGIATKTGTIISGLINERGMPLAFLFIFLGGLALNLTPCVYPMIPITIGYFGGQSENRLQRTMLLACIYVLGIAITYSALGTLAALSGSLFGALLQNQWVLLFVAGILTVMALSMFGFYEIRPPAFLSNRLARAQGGVVGTLFMGVTVGIVAAPCIGPFVIGLLTYVSTTANPLLGFWMFFTLALGLGLPYLFLGLFSGAVSRLPRSGEWMVGVKKIFGLVLLGMALYFLLPLFPVKLSAVLLPLFLIGSGLYIGLVESTAKNLKGFRRCKQGLGTLAVLLGVLLLLPLKSSTSEIPWVAYEPTLLESAKQEGKPVVIDFYADWCIPCKELDTKTFADPQVAKALESFVPLKADLTRYSSPEVEALKAQYQIRGVPTIVFLAPDGKEWREKRVVGFLGPKDFLERIAPLTQKSTY
ncbi:protein-disulfide reductase DsbD [Candidatus Poribacteria bacterium]|nr:protein-disulfide reductase DsbD [Candidatus Poribacteria bacterium]